MTDDGINKYLYDGEGRLCVEYNGPAPTTWAHYNTHNQFLDTSQAPGGVHYDGAGDIDNDGVNQYLYDGDGRICAVMSQPLPSMTTMTGYVYDASGARVQVTEMSAGANGAMTWQHTNVYAAGGLLATYDQDGLHFYLNDPLGTRRAQTDYAGVPEQTCSSLPFGNGLACTGSNQYPTEHHFTGKERDTESGLDYFGARYYASTMGRWTSPDWATKPYPVPYSKLDNPQTLNLYAYVGNNPMNRFDPDGHYSCDTKNHAAECGKIKDALAIVQKADSALKEGSKERGRLDAVLKFYGSENDGKGPSVQFADLSKDGAVGETQTVNGKTTITFDTKALGNFGEAGKGEGRNPRKRSRRGRLETLEKLEKGKRSPMREHTAWMTTLIGGQ